MWRISRFKSILLTGLLIGVMLLGLQVHAITLDEQLTQSLTDLKNVQRQLTSLTQSAYINAVTGGDNTNNLKNLSLYAKKVEDIRTSLLEFQKDNTLTKAQMVEAQTLSATAAYLKFLTGNLKDYMNTTDVTEQYTLLAQQFQASALLAQIFTFVD